MTQQWIDLGDGTALSPDRVGSLRVGPPLPPSCYYMRVFLEEECWRVNVYDHRTSIDRVVFMSFDESAARRRAREIVGQMLAHADELGAESVALSDPEVRAALDRGRPT